MASTEEGPTWLPYAVRGMAKLADLHVKVGEQDVPLHSQHLAQCEVLCDLFQSTPAEGWAAGVQAVFDKVDAEGLRVSCRQSLQPSSGTHCRAQQALIS